MRAFSIVVLSVGVVGLGTAAKADVKVPYFAPISAQDLCGGTPEKCQPTNSAQFGMFKDPVDYTGSPADFIGRKYKAIYETSPCISAPITEADLDRFGKSDVKAIAASQTKAQLKAEINVKLAELLRRATVNLPADVKAKAESALNETVDTGLNQTIYLTYERIQLKPAYMDAHLQKCLDASFKNERAITGISTVTVTGAWSKKVLADTLAKIEAEAGITNLDAETKALWDRDKETAMSGTFQPVSLVFSAAFRKGTKPVSIFPWFQ